MRDREEDGLRQLMNGNRIATAAVSHEVRNLCGAISVISRNLKQRYSISQDEDFEALTWIARGLEKLASTALRSQTNERLEDVSLRAVLDDLRIVIESDWQQIEGIVYWTLPAVLPQVSADRHGLLQALLNLCKNSHRAVEASSRRQLSISVSVEERKATISVRDSGTGVLAPEQLFEPFQSGAEGTGMGLYVSRAMVRSYGGDLRFHPESSGSCFLMDLQLTELPG
jgi:two-component system sensor kinase FixL